MTIHPGNGAGKFLPAFSFAAGGFPTLIATGDFNLDGKPDLAVEDSNNPGMSILTNLSPRVNSAACQPR